MKVWLNGRIVAAEEAAVPVTDHGLLYGDGIFEGLRVYARRVFRLEDHQIRYPRFDGRLSAPVSRVV